MKPDDIPDDVWESAIRCAEVVCRNLPENYGDMTIEIRAIARAILAERARCEAIVGLYADHPSEVVGMAADEIFTAIHAAQKSPTP